MAFAPIALTIPQYDRTNLKNHWMKAYAQGTTTPLSMATDVTGGTLLVKCQLDTQGFPVTAGAARFIPFINGDYDLWLFPTEAEANANDTTNAIQLADNLNSDPLSNATVEIDRYYDTMAIAISKITTDSIVAGDVVNLKERSSGNGGGGTWDAVDATTVTENEYDIVTGNASISFVLRVGDKISFNELGATEALADNAGAMQRAAQIAFDNGITLYSDAKTYKFISQLNFFGVRNINIEGVLKQNFTGVGVILGVDSANTEPSIIYIKEATLQGQSDFIAPANPVLRFQGLKNPIITIGKCHYVQLYADADNNYTDLGGALRSINSVAYATFHMGFVTKVGMESPATTAQSWINENQFFGGRLVDLISSGESNHNNHNIFYAPTFEGETAFPFSINLDRGKSNRIYNARLETAGANSGTIIFGDETLDNVIEASSNTSNNPASGFRALTTNINVTENGFGNLIIRDDFIIYKKITMVGITARDVILGQGINYDSGVKNTVGLQAGLDNIKVLGFVDCYESDFIPVVNGDMFQWDIKSGGDFRSRMVLYDANKTQIVAASDPGHVAFTTATWDAANNLYRTTSSIANDTDECTIKDSVPKFVKIIVRTGGSGPHLASNISVYYYPKRNAQGESTAIAKQQSKAVGHALAPDSGFVVAGFVVGDISAGGGSFTNVFSYEDTLNGALIATATSVTVNNIGSVANGDIVGILLDDGDTHWSAVSALAASTFTVSALPSPAANGNRIVFNRWI